MKPLFENEMMKGLVVTKSKQQLSKKQQEFYKYTASISTLKEKILKIQTKLDDLELICTKELDPGFIKVAKAKFEVATVIADSIKLHKYTQVQLERTKEVISDLCEIAFRSFIPTLEEQNFYNKWAPQSYEEYKEIELNIEKEFLAEMMSDEYGIDVDMSDLKNDPESYFQFQQKLEEQLKEKSEATSTRKKTKKQLAAEEKRKAAEELKSKSLRSVYVSLAKLLHPDLEEDENMKSQKNELMKEVTAAYESKDLPTLLKIEMQWAFKESENIEKLTDEKLDIFISLLKDQVKELKSEIKSFEYNPKYERVADFLYMPVNRALQEIINSKYSLELEYKYILNDAQKFAKPHAKKQIVDFVNGYVENMYKDDDLDDFFDDDDDNDDDFDIEEFFKRIKRKK